MLTHGGDTTGFYDQYGYLPLDFSANVSPLGLPDGVRKAAIHALDLADQYPDPLCRRLISALAEKEKCNPAFIRCGNGAADIIFRLALAKKPKKALLPAPTFAEYQTALEQVGCEILYHGLQNMQVSREILDQITPDIDIMFLCQPNNPTCQLVAPDLMEEILHKCESTGTLLVVDGCFSEFLKDPHPYILQKFLGSQNLLILKAYTKLYAMAGLRLGYCLSGNEELLEQMSQAGQPWSVSCVAQEAGIAALEETDYVNSLLSLLEEERPRLETGLRDLGLTVYPSNANFIFFRGPVTLCQDLREKGILIRNCGNYPGLEPGYYRVAVRTKPENDALLNAIRLMMND